MFMNPADTFSPHTRQITRVVLHVSQKWQMDLVQLFEMIDIDNSGAIEQNEFIRPLSRWVRDSKTAPSTLMVKLVTC